MATRDYTLGKGKVLFKPEGDTAYIDLGNAPAFAINVNIEKLEHFSSREGLSLKDLEVITKLGMGGSFTLDEPNSTNLAMFIMSDAGATANAQGSGSTPADNITNIVLDRWYPLALTGSGTASISASGVAEGPNTGTATVAATGTPAATAAASVKVVVKNPTASGTVGISWNNGDYVDATLTTSGTGTLATDYGPVNGVTFTFSNIANADIGDVFDFAITYSAATSRLTNITSLTVTGKPASDYVVDLKAGLFMALSTGTIAAASTVSFATTVYAANATRVSTTGGTLTSLKGDLYFVGDPPQGRVVDVLGFCSLTPNGDFALIGADWMQIQFNVEFLAVEGQSGLVTLQDRGKIG